MGQIKINHSKHLTHKDLFLWVFILYSIFVVYGSIVPLEFHGLSLSEAWEKFLNLEFKSIYQISRIDWTTNILLGLPTSFFAMGFFYKENGWLRTILVPFLILVFCFFLAGIAEFLQLFLSSRNASMNDIAAQLIGAIIGIFSWHIFGVSLRKAISEFMETHVFSKKINFLFGAYVLFLILYNIMPLDLSINPTDIYHKWERGYLNLVPFAFETESFSVFVYNTVMDILIWIPIAFFLVRYRGLSKFSAIMTVFGIAFIIECVQIPVLSRVSDTTDLVTAFLGGLIGAVAGNRIKCNEPIHSENKKIIFPKRAVKGGGILFFWMIVILFIYWFPFNFEIDKNAIRHQLGGLSLIPFKNYQLNDTYHAITTVFRKIVLFIPGGIILSHTIKDGKIYSNSTNTAIIFLCFVFILCVSMIVEIGQFFLPGKIPDITDILLEIFGAAFGYWSFKQLYASRL